MKRIKDQIYLSQRHPIWGPAGGVACAPSSLYACLRTMGVQVTPKQILDAFVVGSKLYRRLDGSQFKEITAVAEQFGVTVRPIADTCCTECDEFWQTLLVIPKPSLLIVDQHMIAILGSHRNFLKIWDPDFNLSRPRLFGRSKFTDTYITQAVRGLQIVLLV